ncbi:TPA: hypothetical protein QCY42_004326 [Bacillus cereus]|nr:hypothetical protein [Bacillus cereus]
MGSNTGVPGFTIFIKETSIEKSVGVFFLYKNVTAPTKGSDIHIERQVNVMNIPIGDDYLLTSDPFNVILNQRYQKKTEEGEEPKYDFRPIGYYPNVMRACVALLKKQLIVSDATSINELIEVVHTTEQRIIDATKNIKRETEE